MADGFIYDQRLIDRIRLEFTQGVEDESQPTGKYYPSLDELSEENDIPKDELYQIAKENNWQRIQRNNMKREMEVQDVLEADKLKSRLQNILAEHILFAEEGSRATRLLFMKSVIEANDSKDALQWAKVLDTITNILIKSKATLEDLMIIEQDVGTTGTITKEDISKLIGGSNG